MRRAAELWAKYSDDIQGWLIRESGGTHAKTTQELRDAVNECLEASALPSHAMGEVLPSEKGFLLSMSRRVPVGVVGVIAPFNAPVKLAIRSVAPALALGNAVILKPDPRTAVSGGVVFARIFEEAGLPAACCMSFPAARTSVPRWSPTRMCRRFPSPDRRRRDSRSASSAGGTSPVSSSNSAATTR